MLGKEIRPGQSPNKVPQASGRKSITLDRVPSNSSFKMEPNLESLTINQLQRDITINLAEFPNLVSINVHKQNVLFDKSIHKITTNKAYDHY